MINSGELSRSQSKVNKYTTKQIKNLQQKIRQETY